MAFVPILLAICMVCEALHACRRVASWSNTLLKSTPQIGDVIHYQSFDMKIGVGVIGTGGEVFPLSKRSNLESFDTVDDKEVQYVYDEESSPLQQGSFVTKKVFDEVLLTQRIVEDRVSNPHGEHAEDVWIFDGIQIRYLREADIL